VNASDIDMFLTVLERREPQNWHSTRLGDKDCWAVMHRGIPPCKFHVEANLGFVCIHAAIEIQIWAACRLAVYRFALRLNEEMSGAKFGLSHDGQLSLMVELSLDDLTYAHFENAVQILLDHYRIYYPDLQMVSQSEELAGHLVSGEIRQKKEEEAVSVQILKP
jgi:hypothetical protein